MESLLSINSDITASREQVHSRQTEWEEYQSFQGTMEEVERPYEEQSRVDYASEEKNHPNDLSDKRVKEDSPMEDPKDPPLRKDHEVRDTQEKRESTPETTGNEKKAETSQGNSDKGINSKQSQAVTEKHGKALAAGDETGKTLLHQLQQWNLKTQEGTNGLNSRSSQTGAGQNGQSMVTQSDSSLLQEAAKSAAKVQLDATMLNQWEGSLKSAASLPEALKMIPKLDQMVLDQVKANMPKILKGEGRIPLVPRELGEIQVKLAMKDGEPQVRLAATEGLVRNIFQENMQQVKSLFQSAGTMTQQITLSSTEDPSFNGDDLFKDQGQPGLTGSESFKGQGSAQAGRIDMTSPRAEAEISQKYGIQNLQKHLMDQIRIHVARSGKEARIQLHPPELGEIKIHLLMEDQRLVVRMEVSEQLVRSMLERDLQQLKEALQEAGIEVDSFDIESKGGRSHRESGALHNNRHFSSKEGSEEEPNGGPLHEPEAGAVKLSSEEEGVDYLVY